MSSNNQSRPAGGEPDRSYAAAKEMLRDILAPERISGTAIRVARDHMVQFARRIPQRDSTASTAAQVHIPALDDEQFAVLIAGLDKRLQTASDDQMELAWLLTTKSELTRLRSDNDQLRRSSIPDDHLDVSAKERVVEAMALALDGFETDPSALAEAAINAFFQQ